MTNEFVGRVTVRPVLVAMALMPTVASVRQAVEIATSLWAGCYQPILDVASSDRLDYARRLGVDVIAAVDGDPRSQELAAAPGYRWGMGGEWGPLAEPSDSYSTRAAGPEHLFRTGTREQCVLPQWDSADPLAALFTVWFGKFGASPYGQQLQDLFINISTRVTVPADQNLPEEAGTWVTPIGATGEDIDYCGEPTDHAVVLVDPDNPIDLVALWNMRAAGHVVFPWVIGHEDRLMAAFHAWVDAADQAGALNGGRRHDGTPAPRRLVVAIARPERIPAATTLDSVFAALDIQPFAISPSEPHRWRNIHPLHTEISARVSVPLPSGERTVRLSIPTALSSRSTRGIPEQGIIAVDIAVDQVAGLGSDWTFSIPNWRAFGLAHVSPRTYLDYFERSTADGYVLGIHASGDHAVLSAVPAIDVVNGTIAGPGWSGQRTSDGTIATRLIDRLGGPESTLANQPGVRAALAVTAQSSAGCASARIITEISKYQGTWPGRFASDEARKAYPARIFEHLLQQRILRAALPVTCPHCTVTTNLRPDDLRSDMRCDMCLSEYPLGQALGKHPRNDWLYQIASHITSPRVSESLPIMATLHLLAANSLSGTTSMSYTLGWRVHGPRIQCEVDIAAVLNQHGRTTVILGEVKSCRDSIDRQHIDNLQHLQRHIRTRGIECMILVAVNRALREEEITLLRTEFTLVPDANDTNEITPVMPLVLTGQNLSAAPHEQHYPYLWGAQLGLRGLADELCRRNLGLQSTAHSHDGTDWIHTAKWNPQQP